MTWVLVRKFVKNHEEINNPAVRRGYGTLSSIVGIICNILLFAVKYAMGTFSGSIAVISDAFNNLSDSAGCIVTLLGYKMASKPADKDHPFGHGRMEYLTALMIAVLIILVAFELLKNSVEKIIHPEDINFSFIVLASLIFSIIVKLWMSVFNHKLGVKLNSQVMIATAKDSKTDVIATGATVVSIIASAFTSAPVDGIIGILVSVFIFKSGVDIVRDTVDSLLGKPASLETVNRIKEIIEDNKMIIGIHDLVIHNYGPGNMIGSCHAEVKSSEDFLEVHDAIDILERRINEKLGIMMTIHMDPIETDNEQVNQLKSRVKTITESIDPNINIHDFRVVFGETHTNLIFDAVIPYDCKYSLKEIKARIDEGLKEEENTYYTVITFDRAYTA